VEPATPILAMITRLVEQKGLDLIEQIADTLLARPVQLVVLGSGERRYEELMRRCRTRYPERVGVSLGFDEPMAHLIEAGADLFLMPSRYEPCGLNQMYSHRYGTPPIVRATGGLADSVTDYDPATGRGDGFVFQDYSADALLGAIDRALAAYSNQKAWKKLVTEVMRIDHSWTSAARSYVALYEEVRALRRS
jgi:starch synthase